jgi:hypothetical protein
MSKELVSFKLSRHYRVSLAKSSKVKLRACLNFGFSKLNEVFSVQIRRFSRRIAALFNEGSNDIWAETQPFRRERKIFKHALCPRSLLSNHYIIIAVGLSFLFSCQDRAVEEQVEMGKTICNPIDLSYRFMPETPSRREAADPTVVVFKGTYFLFASKSGGYWYSDDLVDWQLVETDQIPTEEYAPTAIVLRDTVFFLASSTTKSTIYKSADPKMGSWEVAKDSIQQPVWDPAFYEDDNGDLFLYWGCSNITPLYGVKINSSTHGFRF